MAKNKYTREDVLKGLDHCTGRGYSCYSCPFFKDSPIDCKTNLTTEVRKLLLKKPKNEAPVRAGQKVWVLCGSSIRRLPVIAVGKDVAILSELSIYGDILYSSNSFNDLGKTWFTRISDAKKAYKEHPTFVTPKADKITFIKVANDAYSIRTKTKL